MSNGTILIHLAGIPADLATMRTGLSIAGRFEANVRVLHVRRDAETAAAVGVGMGGGIVSPQVVETIRAEGETQAAQAKNVMEDCIAQSAVSFEARGLYVDWQDETGEIVSRIARSAMLSDLAVLTAPSATKDGQVNDAADAVLLESGRPALFVPRDWRTLSPTRAVIAWDNSRHAARALFDALPLLVKVEAVTVVEIADEPEDNDIRRVLELLRSHSISADAESIAPSGASVGATLLRYCDEKGADLLVMGSYGKHPMREFMFGGATEKVLHETRIPTLMSH